MPNPISTAPTVEAFVPRGWTIEQRLDGPIDADARPDVVLLLHDADPRNVLHDEGSAVPDLDTNPRLLVVLAADAGGWRHISQSDHLIRRTDSATVDDALENGGLMLDRRVLAVKVGFFASMGSWTMSTTTYRFRWQDGCMRLIGFDEDVVRRNSGETIDTSVDLLTRRATRADGSIEDDARTTHRYMLQRRAPVCLEDVDDGFDPRVPGR